jgi:fumarate reductase subunit D
MLNSMSADSLDDITNLDESRVYAALSYLLILVLVPWLMRRGDPFVNWHVRQGLVVFIAIIAAVIAAAWVPTIGGIVVLLLFIGDIVALVMALQGRRWRIPVLGLLADTFRV